MTSVPAQGITELFGVLEEFRPLLEDRHRVLGPLDVVEQFRILSNQIEDGVPEVLLNSLRRAGCHVGHRLRRRPTRNRIRHGLRGLGTRLAIPRAHTSGRGTDVRGCTRGDIPDGPRSVCQRFVRPHD